MDSDFAAVITVLDILFVFVYVSEACIKLKAFGMRQYFKSGMNCLDFFIVAVALIGYAVEVSAAQGVQALRAVRAVRIVRAARALRIGKLLFHNAAISNILGMAFSSWGAAVGLTALIFFVLGMSAIFALHMFSECDSEEIAYRINYFSWWSAIMANFTIMTEDNFAAFMCQKIHKILKFRISHSAIIVLTVFAGFQMNTWTASASRLQFTSSCCFCS